MPRTQSGHGHHRYTRESIERALTLHLGEPSQSSWLRRADGYTVATGVGILTLRTLREAYMFVVGMAEKGRRADATVLPLRPDHLPGAIDRAVLAHLLDDGEA